jgi:hypothetical protein
MGKDEPANPIAIDEHNLLVTNNLKSALHHIHLKDKSRKIWIDVICINQKDDIEKSQRVRQMAKIYSKASKVLVWLGEAYEDSWLLVIWDAWVLCRCLLLWMICRKSVNIRPPLTTSGLLI